MGLFTPAWNSKTEERALRAVEKMTDRTKLARVAKKAKNREVRYAAFAKLTDQDRIVLADVAKNADYSDVRYDAVAKLTDQRGLADVAKNAGDSDVRKAAVANLTDQGVLADLAKNDSDSDVRQAAVSKLTNPEALKSVVEKYLSDISIPFKANCDQYEWDQIRILISIAKDRPQFLKKNWGQINQRIKNLHRDIKHDDNGRPISSSDCSHVDIRAVNETAASQGLVFPPYPFDDSTA
jgi:predicted regulator of amino acid metabolism with ACT domain